MINFPDSPSTGNTFSVGTTTFVWDGEKWKGATDQSNTEWVSINTNYTMLLNTSYDVDFSSPRTLTLPQNAALNDHVVIYNATGDTRNSTIAINGQSLMGLNENMTIDQNILILELIFDGSTWLIHNAEPKPI